MISRVTKEYKGFIKAMQMVVHANKDYKEIQKLLVYAYKIYNASSCLRSLQFLGYPLIPFKVSS